MARPSPIHYRGDGKVLFDSLNATIGKVTAYIGTSKQTKTSEEMTNELIVLFPGLVFHREAILTQLSTPKYRAFQIVGEIADYIMLHLHNYEVIIEDDGNRWAQKKPDQENMCRTQ
jgi:hypothetical protein